MLDNDLIRSANVSIDRALITAQARDIQGIAVSESRAGEIAVEVDSLLTGVSGVLDSVEFLDDPDGFRAVLWELRETR